MIRLPGLASAIALCWAAAVPDGVYANTPDFAQRVSEAEKRDRFGVPDEDVAFWQAIVEEMERGDARPGIESRALMRLGVAQYYAEQHAQGKASLERALALLEGKDEALTAHRSEILSYLSLVEGGLGNYDASRDRADQALSEAQIRFGADSAASALALNVSGIIAMIRGDQETALRDACLAAELSRKHRSQSDFLTSMDMFNCGIAMSVSGDDDEALIAYMTDAMAFTLANTRADHPHLGYLLKAHSVLLKRLGRSDEVEAVARRALAIFEGNDVGRVIGVLDSRAILADALFRQGKLEEAEAIATDLLDRAPVSPNAAVGLRTNTLALLAQISLARGEGVQAERYFSRAIDAYERELAPNLGWLGLFADHALALQAVGRRDEAAAVFERLERTMAKEPSISKVLKDYISLRRAVFLSRDGDAQAALPMIRPAVEMRAKTLLALTSSRSELVALSGTTTSDFGEAAYIALAAGEIADGFRYAQLANLSGLSVAASQSGARLASDDRELAGALKELRRRQKQSLAFQRQLSTIGEADDPERRHVTIEEQANQAASRDLRARIEREWPAYTALQQTRLHDLEQVQSGLADGDLLIVPLSLGDRFVTIAVGPDTVTWGESPLPRPQVQSSVKRLRAAFENPAGTLSAQNFPVADAVALYQALAPEAVAPALAGARRLLLPASGPVASLPAAALLTHEPDDGSDWPWLVRSKQIVVAAGLGTDGETRDRPQPVASRFLGIGAPRLADGGARREFAALFRSGATAENVAALPPLPETQRELEELRSAIGSSDSLILTAGDATQEGLAAIDFDDYDIVAFATHGLVSGELNGLIEPALVLTPVAGEGPGNDGLLTASEIAMLDIPADWVILSACNTAAGDGAASPSYSGLARAFRQAGARSLLLSHWRVRDDVAARLTVATVRNAAAGMDRAEALRQAQLELMRDPDLPGAAHPALWAPFVLIDG